MTRPWDDDAEDERGDLELMRRYEDEDIRRLRALYEGEKRAGLLKSREEYEQDLRDAGRGHLIKQ